MSWLARRKNRGREARDALAAELRRPQPTEDGRLIGEPKGARRAPLAGLDLHDADLRWADLQHCDLRDADLSGAQLDGADLSWATLTGADLHGARFGRARLVEAELRGADVSGTDLSRVTGLTWASVRDVLGAREAIWPAGFDASRPTVAGPLLHTRPRQKH